MESVIDQIAARKNLRQELEAREALPENLQRSQQHRAAIAHKLGALVQSNSARKIKIYKLQELMSEFRDHPVDELACQRGCDYCCHLSITLSQSEANAIGERIGRCPAQLPRNYRLRDANAYGRHTPCTFLRDGACSIYEHRPLMCRQQVNADRDSLMCSFENWDLSRAGDPRAGTITKRSARFIEEAYLALVRNDVHGDLRDFFAPD